jgi:hypothetical protein
VVVTPVATGNLDNEWWAIARRTAEKLSAHLG